MTDTAHRTRSISALFAGVGLSATGFIALITVTPLAAEVLLGDARRFATWVAWWRSSRLL